MSLRVAPASVLANRCAAWKVAVQVIPGASGALCYHAGFARAQHAQQNQKADDNC